MVLVDPCAVYREHNIALSQPGFIGRTMLLDLDDERAPLHVQVFLFLELRSNHSEGHSQIGLAQEGEFSTVPRWNQLFQSTTAEVAARKEFLQQRSEGLRRGRRKLGQGLSLTR